MARMWRRGAVVARWLGGQTNRLPGLTTNANPVKTGDAKLRGYGAALPRYASRAAEGTRWRIRTCSAETWQ